MAQTIANCLIKYALIGFLLGFLGISFCAIFGIDKVPTPHYHWITYLVLDFIFLIGLVGSISDNLNVIIIFSWVVGLLLMLSFFGVAVSIHPFSDVYSLLYVLIVTFLSFGQAAAQIHQRYRDRHEDVICCYHQFMPSTSGSQLTKPKSPDSSGSSGEFSGHHSGDVGCYSGYLDKTDPDFHRM